MTTELESLVIRLVGDATDYLDTLKSAQQASKEAAEDVDKELQKLMHRGEQITQSFATAEEKHAQTVEELDKLLSAGAITFDTYWKAVEEADEKLKAASEDTEELKEKTLSLDQAANALVGTLAGLGAKAWLQQALGEWQEAESASLRLDAALTANGRNVQKLGEDYREFASHIQRVSTTSDDAAVAMLQQAETFGVTGEAAKRAVMNTVAAQSNGLQVSLRMMAMLEQGNTQMLGRILPGLRGIKDESERAAKAQEMLTKMQAGMTATAESSAGRMIQLKNNYGDFLETVGKLVATGLDPLVKVLNLLALKMQQMPEWLVGAIVVVASLTTAFVVLATTLPTVIAGIAAVQTAVITFSTALATNPMTAWIVGIGVLVAALAVAGTAIAATDDSYRKTNELIAARKKALEQEADAWRKTTNEAVASAKKMEQAEGLEFLRGELDKTEKEIQRFNQRLEADKERMSAAQGIWGTPRQAAEARRAIEETTGALEMARGRANELHQAMDQISGVNADDEVKELTRSLEKQLATLGMTEEQVARYELAKKGASQEQLKAVEGLQLELDAQKRMNEEKEEAVKAEMEVAAAYAKTWADKQQAMDEEAKAMEEAGVRETEKAFAESRRILDSLQTPFDKLQGKIAETMALVGQGLSQEDAEKYVKKLTDEYDKTQKKVDKVKDSVKSLSAVLVGSAEDAKLMDEFFSKNFKPEPMTPSRQGPSAFRYGATPTGVANVGAYDNSDAVTAKILKVLEDIRRQGENSVVLESPKFGR